MLRIITITVLTLTYFTSTLSAQRMAPPEADILSDQVIVKAQSESDVQRAIEDVQNVTSSFTTNQGIHQPYPTGMDGEL